MYLSSTLFATLALVYASFSAPASPAALPKPTRGATWQIQIETIVTNFDDNAQVYDIDLFENNADVIKKLHDKSKYVICYFSAGTREHKRPDDKNFDGSSTGNNYNDPNGRDKEETWFKTSEDIVRTGMAKRIKMASDMGCDAIDPDNVDTYDNDTGFNTGDVEKDQATSVDYLKFMQGIAAGYNMGMGLKNSADIVPTVLDIVDFQVNENCANLTECATFRPFIQANKPVFEIEYPDYLQTDGAPINKDDWTRLCGDTQEDEATQRNHGFSTVLKNFGLGEFTDPCGASPVTPPAVVDPGN